MTHTILRDKFMQVFHKNIRINKFYTQLLYSLF